MKIKKNKSSVVWGIALLFTAVALILEGFGVLTALSDIAGGISLPRILLAIALICIAVIGCRRHPYNVVWYLAFLFMLFESNIAHLCGREDPNLINNWLLLLCALMIKLALLLLFGKSTFQWNFKGHPHFHSPSFITGSNTVYIDCTNFENKYVENNLGATDIYFTNIESYTGGARLTVENNLGQTNIHVPAAWSLSMDTENNLGHIDAPADGGACGGPVLHLYVENNLGHVDVCLV